MKYFVGGQTFDIPMTAGPASCAGGTAGSCGSSPAATDNADQAGGGGAAPDHPTAERTADAGGSDTVQRTDYR